MTVVVDTNVILVANGQHQDVSMACVASCATRLHGIVQNGRVAIDDGHRILKEYRQKTDPNIGKRAGDAFLKWLLRNNVNPLRCEQVHLVEHSARGFESFPEDERLSKFDAPDRKFIAVAAALPQKAPILQAADSKWLEWAKALNDHGITVDFLCRKDIQKFDDQKKGRKGKRR